GALGMARAEYPGWKKAIWILPGAGLVVGLLLIVSVVAPCAWAAGSNGVSLRRGTLQVAHATCPLAAKQGAWTLRLSGGRGTMLLGPTGGWRPHMASGSVTVGAAGARVTAVFVPLWPWALALLGTWQLLRRRVFKSRKPYECAKCGYDRRGLPTESAPCPEC